MPRATRGLLSLLLLCTFLLAGCQRQPEPLQFSGATMGTSYHVTVVPGDATLEPAALQAAVAQRLTEINQSMSTYIANSELNRVNDAAVGEWIAISDDLFNVLMLSTEVGWLSGGAFDITVGPLVDLWGFGPGERKNAVPEPTALAAARKRVGFKHLELELGTPSVRKNRPLRIDLSAVAKGYGVDEVAELLVHRGHTDFLVEIGGEVRVAGNSPRGTPWRIAIEKPGDLPGEVQVPILVSDRAVATSGDYRNYFEHEGARFSHTIDPVTGRPVQHELASVTVIANSAAYADALATALEVLGPERALRLAEQQGLAVYLIVREKGGFRALHSAAFADYLETKSAGQAS